MMDTCACENQRRSAIVAEARRWIGTPYRHQATLRGVGCDCLGLVRGVWRAVVGAEPETPPAYTPNWAVMNSEDLLLDAALRHFTRRDSRDVLSGDVLLFRWRPEMPARHLAIAVSDTLMVHAHEGAAVCEVTISQWWRRHLAHVFCFPDTPSR